MRYNHNCTENDVDADFFHIWPTPFESIDAGDVFEWESYFIIIHKSPSLYGYYIDDVERTLERLFFAVTAKGLSKLSGKELMRGYLDELENEKNKTINEKKDFKAFLKKEYPIPPLTYNYALLAYESKNESTFTSNPVMCVGIANVEYAIYEKLKNIFNEKYYQPLEGEHKTFYLLSKISDHRNYFYGGFHLKPYLKELTSESQKNSLLRVTKNQLGLSGYPNFVCSIDSLRNHNFLITHK
jgi:hypothetical protein